MFSSKFFMIICIHLISHISFAMSDPHNCVFKKIKELIPFDSFRINLHCHRL